MSILDQVSTIAGLELDELKREEAELERALAFVRGARQGLEELEARPVAVTDFRRILEELRGKITAGGPGWLTPTPDGEDLERENDVGRRLRARNAQAIADGAAAPEVDLADVCSGVLRAGTGYAYCLLERRHVGDHQGEDANRMRAKWPSSSPDAATFEHEAARLGDAWLERAALERRALLGDAGAADELASLVPLAERTGMTEEELADVDDEPGIVAGVNLPELRRKADELAGLYARLDFPVLEQRARAGEFDHELDARLVNARRELDARDAAAADTVDEAAPPAPEANIAASTAGAEGPPAPDPSSQDPAPADPPTDPREDWTNDERILELVAAWRGIHHEDNDAGWFTVDELAAHEPPAGYTLAWSGGPLKQRLHKIARGEGDLRRPVYAERGITLERDGTGGFRLEDEPAPAPRVLSTEEAEARLRLERSAAPEPGPASFPGRILEALANDALTAQQIGDVLLLDRGDRGGLLLDVGRLVDAGELYKAGNADSGNPARKGPTIYRRTRAGME